MLRKAEYHKNTGHKIRGVYYLSRLRKLQNKYSMHIPLNVFDKGLKIMHLGPILVNGSVVAGKNCTLHMNTAIVSSEKKSLFLETMFGWATERACSEELPFQTMLRSERAQS